MKNLLYILLLFPFGLIGQTTGQNYVKSTVYKQPYTTITATSEKDVQISYFDGLGRQEQSVQVGAGGGNEDIVNYYEYDIYGRQIKEYLPYARINTGSVTGPYQANVLNDLLEFYNKPKYENTLNPYSEKRFENSPLNRIKDQGAPGDSWKLPQPDPDDYFIMQILYAAFNDNVCINPYPYPIDYFKKLPKPWLNVEVKDNILTFTMFTEYGGII